MNIAGLPGMSVPCGFATVEGKQLPLGLQIMAKPFDEATLLRIGHATSRRPTGTRAVLAVACERASKSNPLLQTSNLVPALCHFEAQT